MPSRPGWTNQRGCAVTVAAWLDMSGAAGPHDLVRMMRSGSRQYRTTSESHCYAEPKRLARLGHRNWLDEIEREPGPEDPPS